MTAGRGIVHSEMPEQEQGLMRGFQLWVNLPSTDKMTAPRYQDIPANQVPEVTAPGGARLRILAGSHSGVAGPVNGVATQPIYFDIHLEAGQVLNADLPKQHTAFVYVYEGAADVGGLTLRRGQLGVLGQGESVGIEGREAGSSVLLVAGRPLHEPIARYGPFVMNTEAEIQQAFADFRSGRL
jgi:redox-sensitive bicupin YhaK (pirin superfamily)